MTTNESGATIRKAEYRPFGERVSNSTLADGDTISFTGYSEDDDTGLSYAQARWYNPEIGRFVSIDPVGVNPANVHLFNRYAYANNNPYRYVDPDGRIPLLVPWVAAGVLFVYDLISMPDLPPGHENDAITSVDTFPGPTKFGGDLYKKADGIAWPPNRGFEGESALASLILGTKVDRYGRPDGIFLAPDGTPFPMRSLPASSEFKPLNTYEAMKPIEVNAGPVTPWFNQPGGGLQFELPRTVQELVDSGDLKRVD